MAEESIGLVFVDLGLVIFLLFCPPYFEVWGVFVWGFFGCFFSPSLVGESSLSLLLFKFMDISMGSVVWLSFVVNYCFAVVDCFVIVVVVVKVVASVVLFSVVAVFLGGVFFPPFFLVTCVHPSSFSLGFSSWFCVVFVGVIAAMTGEGVAVIVVVVVDVVITVGF